MTYPILYIVSTPIGNLSDFSIHAQNILASVSFILCEDTRHTLKLLNHFGIKNQLESLHAHNEKEKINYLINKILTSKNPSVALVSDAGTPAICDPGSYIVAAAHEYKIKIISIPGPSSMTSALAASGFIQPRSLFSGFLKKSKAEQFEEFNMWVTISPCVAVFFESPRRILESLKNLKDFFKSEYKIFDNEPVQVCLSREISKKFEEHQRDTLANIICFLESQEEILGEFVVCVNLNKIKSIDQATTLEFAAKEAVLRSQLYSFPLKQSCKEIGEKYNFNPKDIYAIASKIR